MLRWDWRLRRSMQTPKWYFTSPDPSSDGSKVENWERIVAKGWRQTLERTLRRPLWGIPMTTESTPRVEERSITWNSNLIFHFFENQKIKQKFTCLIAGIKTSHPSKPNLFSLGHFFAKNSSNLVDLINRLKRTFFCAAVNSVTLGASKWRLIHSCCS